MTTAKTAKTDSKAVVTIVIEVGGQTHKLPITSDETKNFLKYTIGENSLNANGSVYLLKR